MMKLNVGEMHSDLEQVQREFIMHEFKSGRINILVATDIVSRGIDIDDIRLVINFDVPHDSEDYVHRIGRTARANNDGVALTFVNEKEQTNFKNIENFLEKEIYKIPVPAELGEAPQYNPRSYTNAGRGGRNFRNGNRKIITVDVLRHPDRAEDKRKAFLPFSLNTLFTICNSSVRSVYLYFAAVIFSFPSKLMVRFTRLHTGLSGIQTSA